MRFFLTLLIVIFYSQIAFAQCTTPTITASGQTTFCQGGNVVLNSSTAAGWSYQWKLNGTNIPGATSSSFTASTSGSYTVTISDGSVPCSSTSTETVVTVNPIASIANSSLTICSGAGFSVTPQDGGGNTIPIGTQYSWTVANDSVSGESNSSSMQSSIGQTLVNSTGNNQLVVYTVSPQTGTCLGSPFTISVTVSSHVIPNVTDPADQSICAASPSSSTNFVSPLNIPGTIFSWTNSNTSIGLAQTNGIGNINSFISTNSTNSAINSTIVVTPSYTVSGLTCTGASQTFIITVKPLPSMTSSASLSICSGATLNLSLSSNISSTYTWQAVSNSNVGGESASVQSTATINNTLTNATALDQIVSYTVIPTSNGCPGSSQSVSITVKPLPSMTSASSASICSGTNPWSFSLTSNISSTYTWQAASNNNVGGESTSGQTTAAINNTLTNSTLLDQIVVYTVTPSANGCTGASQTVSITVKPLPSMTSAIVSNICSGGTLNFPLTSNISSTYTWQAASNNNVGGESTVSQSTSVINNTLTNPNTTDQLVVYSVVPTANGCPGSSQSVSITVKPLPSMTSVSAVSICSGAPLNVQLTSNILSTYSWIAASNGNVVGESLIVQNNAVINNTLSHSFNSNQVVDYTVIPTSNGCPGPPQTLSITLKPIPTVNPITSQLLCSGNPTAVVSFSSSFGVSGTSYSWTNSTSSIGLLSSGSNNISSFITSNTTNTNSVSTITVTPSANGCPGSPQQFSITVKPTPSIPNLQDTICSEQQFTFIPANGINGIVPASTFLSWTVSNSNVVGEFGDSAPGIGTISQTLTNTNYANNIVTYQIVPAANGCVGNSFNLNVTVKKAPKLIVTPSSSICAGNSIQLFAIDSLSTGQLFYNWSNASTLNNSYIFNPIAYPTSTTSYSVSVTDNTTQCEVTRHVTVNVEPLPTANILYNGSNTICEGNSVELNTDSSIGYSYQWKLNDINIPNETNPTYAAASSGVYSVVVTNSNGCSKTSNGQTVIVNPLPIADISNLSTTTFCQGESVILTTTAIPGNSYQWYNGTSMVVGATSAAFTAVTSGLYTVVVTNNATCVAASPVASVTVNALPNLNVTADDSELCVGESTVLHVTGASSYSWTPASVVSNSSIANPNVFPTSTTNFGVTGTDLNGCSDYQEIQIVVVPNPTLNLPSSISACQGTNVTLPGLGSIVWLGVTSSNNFNAQQSGYAIAVLQNSNLCSAVDSIYIQVNALPLPNITGADTVCANSFYVEYSVPSTGNLFSWNVSNGELQGVDNGNSSFIHWFDQEYGSSTFVVITEHDINTGCEGSDTLFVEFDGLAPNTTNVSLLYPNGSTLFSADHYAIMNWGSTIISNNADEYTDGHAQYYTFDNFDTALRYYWIEAGDDSLCLTRSYFNAPVWQVGVQEIQEDSFVRVYPNPTSGVLNLSINAKNSISSFSIYDCTGHLVKQEFNFKNQSVIDVSELPVGFYILKANDIKGSNFNQTFIKQ